MNNENVKFLLNWNHFSDHLSACMTKLMTDSSYSDIIIATADKHMIYSHRFVLANSSKYFQRLLKHLKRQKGIQLVVALPEIKYEIFKILMNYMYKGETQVPHELLPSVIKAGQILEINGLVNLSENEGGGNCSSLIRFNSSSDPHSRCSVFHGPGSNGSQSGDYNKIGRISSLKEKVNSKEPSKNCLNLDRRTRSQNDGESNECSTVDEDVKVNNKNRLAKSSKSKSPSQDKKNYFPLPTKKKSALKEIHKKTSSIPSPTSVPLENVPPKKSQKRTSATQDVLPIKIKKENESSDQGNDGHEVQELDEKITIKMELPDEIEEVVYNELQCEFCHEVYTNPSDWVRHMTDQHGDRGYKSYKDNDKSVGGSAVITCVVCSCVLFSAAEWARHLRMWHTDRELALANMTALNKNNTNSNVKKKQELKRTKNINFQQLHKSNT